MKKSSLTALVRDQLKLARQASSQRSAHTVYGGHKHVLRQTLIALTAGPKLDEHENPGDPLLHADRIGGTVGSIYAEACCGAAQHLLVLAPRTGRLAWDHHGSLLYVPRS